GLHLAPTPGTPRRLTIAWKRALLCRVPSHTPTLITVLVPKSFTALRGYTREQLVADTTAGIIVGIVALPLAIAFAIASGVTPDRGLYTAIIAGFLISLLGGSRVQIGGPTGA